MTSMCQKMMKNQNLLQSFLLALCLYTKINITCSIFRYRAYKDHFDDNFFEIDKDYIL